MEMIKQQTLILAKSSMMLTSLAAGLAVGTIIGGWVVIQLLAKLL